MTNHVNFQSKKTIKVLLISIHRSSILNYFDFVLGTIHTNGHNVLIWYFQLAYYLNIWYNGIRRHSVQVQCCINKQFHAFRAKLKSTKMHILWKKWRISMNSFPRMHRRKTNFLFWLQFQLIIIKSITGANYWFTHFHMLFYE